MTYLKPQPVLACISHNNNLERCKITPSAILLHLQHFASSVFNTGSQFPDALHAQHFKGSQKGSQFNSRSSQLFYFFFPPFSFSSTFFFCIIFDFFNEKAPYISIFLKKRKTTIRGGPLTFEGGGAVEDLRKKIPAKPFKQRKTLASEKKLLHKPILSPPSLKVKWSKLISGRMDFKPHIKKVRLSSHLPF